LNNHSTAIAYYKITTFKTVMCFGFLFYLLIGSCVDWSLFAERNALNCA